MRTLQVSPPFAVHNQTDQRTGYTVFGRQFALRSLAGGVFGSDIEHLSIGEFGPTVMLSTGHLPVLNSVPAVIQCGSSIQVTGAYAPQMTVPASVEHEWRLGWRLVSRSQDVGDDVRQPAPSPDGEAPVAVRVRCSCPDPAWAEFGGMFGDRPVFADLLPKPVGGRALIAQCLTDSGAISPTPAPDVPEFHAELARAAPADSNLVAGAFTAGGDVTRLAAVDPLADTQFVGTGEEVSIAASTNSRDGTMVGHRDHSSVSDPDAVVTGCVGVTSCLDFTISDQIRRAA